MTTAIERMFRIKGDEILNSSVLLVKDKEYRICEIEFYYYEKDVHDDKYTHCDELQLEYNKFYPHRINQKGFKSGTYKCMDITYGNKDKNIFFGILIRSMKDIETDEFFTGPCVCVRELLNNYGATEWKDLDENVISFVNKKFKLKNKKLEPHEIYVGPRVGLSDRYPDFTPLHI